MQNRPILLAVALAFSTFGCADEMRFQPTTAPSALTSSALDRPQSITAFGAVGDGTTLNTVSIQKAIDSVATTGGTVVIPAGTYLSGALFLKPGVNLHLEKDAVLKGSTDVAHYPKAPTRIEGHTEPWLPALVNADKADHLRVSGEGTLDGSGEPFWIAFRTTHRENRSTKNLDVPRPRLLFIQNSEDVQVTGIRLKDSGFWNLHLYRCNNVLIDGVDIRSTGLGPSTDGIDIDSSQHVTVKNCFISVGDDCIALKGSKGPFAMQDKDSPPVEHIRISDTTFAAGGGIATCGSEATIVRDVIIENCKIISPGNTGRGLKILRLKLRPDTPQLYEDIHFRNISLDGNGELLLISPWKQYFDLMGQPAPTRIVRNITMENIKGKFGNLGSMQGNEGDVIEGVMLKDMDIQFQNPKGKFVGIKDLKIENVMLNGEALVVP